MKKFGTWGHPILEEEADKSGMMPIHESSRRALGEETPRGVPMQVFLSFAGRAKSNHGGQSPGELRRRGGLSPGEMMAILRDEPLSHEHVRDEAAQLVRVLAWFQGWGWTP